MDLGKVYLVWQLISSPLELLFGKQKQTCSSIIWSRHEVDNILVPHDTWMGVLQQLHKSMQFAKLLTFSIAKCARRLMDEVLTSVNSRPVSPLILSHELIKINQASDCRICALAASASRKGKESLAICRPPFDSNRCPYRILTCDLT